MEKRTLDSKHEMHPMYICFHFWYFILFSSHRLFLSLFFFFLFFWSAKLIDIYRTWHNISASTGLSDPAVATGISDLIYESKPAATESDTLDDDLVNAWAVNLGDVPAVNRVRNYVLLDLVQVILLFKDYGSRIK